MAFKTAKWSEEIPEESTQVVENEEVVTEKNARREANAELREVIRLKLEAEGEFEFARKLWGCGLPYPLTCTGCGASKVVETHCKRRWCPACSWLVAQKRLERYGGAVALMADPTALTLTVENSSDPECIRKLRKDWAKMRRRTVIRDKVKGGIVAVEVTNTGKGWHPHLHAIIDCPWLSIATPRPHWSDTPEEVKDKCRHAQFELCHLWASVCGQEIAIAHIKRCRSDAALVYSLKYAIAGSDLAESPDPIGPLIAVLEKSRLLSCFGSLYGRTKEMEGDDKPGCTCPNCGQEKVLMPTEVANRYWGIDPVPKLAPAHFGPDFQSSLAKKLFL